MATIAALSVLVDADTRRFKQGMRGVSRDIQQAERAGIGMTRNLRTMAFQATAVAGALAVGTAALGKFAEAGSKSIALQTAFRTKTGDVTASLELLRTATSGLVGDMELMTQANFALTLGSAENVQQFAEMAEVAQKLGRALGLDTAFALNSLNVGIARQSRLVLDNVGLIVNAEDANRKYAAALGLTVDQLTDAQKQEAFREEALRQAAVKSAELGEVTLTAGDAYRQFVVEIGNTTTALQEQVAQSDLVQAFFEALTKGARIARGEVGGLEENLKGIRDAGFSPIVLGQGPGPSGPAEFFAGRAEGPDMDAARARMEQIRAETEAVRELGNAERTAFMESELFRVELEGLNNSLRPLPLILLDASGRVLDFGDAAHLTGTTWLPEVDMSLQLATASMETYTASVHAARNAQADFNDVLSGAGRVLGGLGGIGRLFNVGLPFLGPAGGALSALTSFSGFFAQGGEIPSGSFGIVGERGPEIVQGPASVTPGGAITLQVTMNGPGSRQSAADRDQDWIRALGQDLKILMDQGFSFA